MSQLPPDELLNKVALLEERLGMRATYRILEPFYLDPQDILEIQRAAKTLADFAGLPQFVFIVSAIAQKKNVGGQIDLRHGEEEVFIEVSQETANYQEAVLATLAHEIAHKVLHVNGISVGSGPFYQYENEILTDVAAVFMGLGKVLLNGCECHRTVQEATLGGTKSTTHSLKSGYLGLDQSAFVYLLTCSMRNIAPAEYERALNSAAIQALRTCRAQFPTYFDAALQQPDANSQLIGEFRRETLEVQRILLSIDNMQLFLREATLTPTEGFLNRTHNRLRELHIAASQTAEHNAVDPCMKYINVLRLKSHLESARSEIAALASEARAFDKGFARLGTLVHTLRPPFSQPSPELFRAIKCRICGAELSLSRDIAPQEEECPKCHYRFPAGGPLPAFGLPTLPPASRHNETLTAKLKSFFRRR